ncbi:hypothetical protein [Lentilitoribacter sp. Alg239-R112]|uniref:hypothetical protein n=1 Tax=Lentilitoribacter sp. Alg239-R112 TaxID=2305987 RepID=UPI0013A6F2C3|nr:hypothetical protein [Lentilitoribacter sp. Alg239-R112]
MEDYNFWQDFFDTYQSLSDWMKFAWLIVPPIFLLTLIVLLMKYRLAKKPKGESIDGELIYSVRAETEDELKIYRHDHDHFPKDTVVPLLIDERTTQDRNISKQP